MQREGTTISAAFEALEGGFEHEDARKAYAGKLRPDQQLRMFSPVTNDVRGAMDDTHTDPTSER